MTHLSLVPGFSELDIFCVFDKQLHNNLALDPVSFMTLAFCFLFWHPEGLENIFGLIRLLGHLSNTITNKTI